MISVRNLCKTFNGQTVLNNISTEIDKGEKVAVSKVYASLDTCKKGIAALMQAGSAPIVPLGTPAPNPKFEVSATREGYRFIFRSQNGKDVLISRVYATEKAMRRAISMLCRAVDPATVVFAREAEEKPIRVGTSKTAAKREKSRAKKEILPIPPMQESDAAEVFESDLPAWEVAEESPLKAAETKKAEPIAPIRETPTAAAKKPAADAQDAQRERALLGTVRRVPSAAGQKSTSKIPSKKPQNGVTRGFLGRIFKK